MNAAEQFRRAARIERALRAEGVDAVLIPGIIGAAFMASLTNLPPVRRRQVIVAHLAAVRAVFDDTVGSPQAPGGPMPGL
jgi:hypothetical protein